ncbi:MAG: hypothetical protein SF123_00215 [Chloroflexota bacterium]|nr:hypothetical protein [Chloroflexota bacterium]
MAGKTTGAPWQALEQQAYHAWREWPLWLALRERELNARLGARPPGAAAAGTPEPDAGSRQRVDRGEG